VHHFIPWQERARCRDFDPEIFFPEKGGSSREAKRICAECPVKAECLEAALAARESFGVWGGLNEYERRQLLARRAG
jgi:WhiB family redox-sensing transcriptional regulator